MCVGTLPVGRVGLGLLPPGVVCEGKVVVEEGGELTLPADIAADAVVLEGSERESTLCRLGRNEETRFSILLSPYHIPITHFMSKIMALSRRKLTLLY